MKPKLLILSPHMDDGILSCGDHVVGWKKKYSVKILTIFTQFQPKNLPQYSRNYFHNSGYSTTSQFYKGRLAEDKAAMGKAEVQFEYFNFTDGGFRLHENQPIYSKKSHLFSGKISLKDTVLINNLAESLKKIASHQQVLIPLGVGKHADHLITRQVAEQIWPSQSISYYADMPYATHISEWISPQVLKKLTLRISYKPVTSFKQSVLSCYSSQIPLLFNTQPPQFPEIVFKSSNL